MKNHGIVGFLAKIQPGCHANTNHIHSLLGDIVETSTLSMFSRKFLVVFPMITKAVKI